MNTKIRFSVPIIRQNEINNVIRVFKESHQSPITNGGQVLKFETRFSEYLGGGFCVAVSSCTAALHLALMAKGIGSGDEVIIATMTHVAIADAIEAVGARPVFCDSHIDSGNLDPDKLPYLITERTRAIYVVHFLGQPCYAKTLQSICRDKGILLIVDSALSLGAKHEVAGMTGLIGDAAAFSFYPAKQITTVEGGMFVTRDPVYAENVRKMRRFGHAARDHDIHMAGLNYRMTDDHAAIGIAQLAAYPAWQTKRRRNAAMLRGLLQDYWIIGGDYALSVFVEDRDGARQRLTSAGIETSVYYPRPIHQYSYWREKYGEHKLPVAEKISRETITLPIGPHLEADDMKFMAEEFKRCALPL